MLRNYLAAALRNLVRNRLYAAVTIFGLAVAFASAILIGLYLRHELTYDRFIPGHERTFLVRQSFATRDKPLYRMDYSSAALAGDLKLAIPQIQYAARLANFGFPPTLRRGDLSVSERSFAWADPDFFKLMPYPAIAGDPARALEAPDALVLTRSAARKYFGKDAPLGAQLSVDGVAMRVAAVIEDLPSNSHLATDVFASSLAPSSMMRPLERAGYTSNSILTYVRLKPGASAASVNAELAGFVARRIAPLYRRMNPDEHYTAFFMRLEPLTAIHTDPADGGDPKPGADIKVLAGLGVIGALIVMVAAINFVTLMTARASRRAVEVGVRKALGAERRDLIAQFMGEAMIYVAVALLIAVSAAELLLPAVNAALQRKMTFDYLANPALLAAILAVAVGVAMLAGLYPALVLSSFRPSTVLKGGPVATGRAGGVVRQALVVAQFAVLVALLLSTTTIFRQTAFALRDATHIDKDGVMMLFAQPCTDAMRDAVAKIPGVQRAACSSPSAIGLGDSNQMVQANGRKEMLHYSQVDFGFFEVYRVRPEAGRLFQADRPGDDGALLKAANPPIVINETAMRELGFRSPREAIGKPLSWSYNRSMRMGLRADEMAPYGSSDIVGVIPDISFGSVRQKVDPKFYYVGPKTDMLQSSGLNIRIDKARMAQALSAIDRLWPTIAHGQAMQRFSADQLLLRLYIDNVIRAGSSPSAR
jgi:putative ABC transport system permease protein